MELIRNFPAESSATLLQGLLNQNDLLFIFISFMQPDVSQFLVGGLKQKIQNSCLDQLLHFFSNVQKICSYKSHYVC